MRAQHAPRVEQQEPALRPQLTPQGLGEVGQLGGEKLGAQEVPQVGRGGARAGRRQAAGGEVALSDFKGKADVVLVFYCYDWGSI